MKPKKDDAKGETSNVNDSVPSKVEILMRYAQLQQHSATLMFQSEEYKNHGDLDAALAAYAELIASLNQQLELVLLNNRHYPDSPFDIPPIVDPLLNALLVQADVFEALGDQEKAEEVREQAMSLSAEYLPQSETAERERQRASSLIGQGRFNEALVLLAAVRDRFREGGDPLSMASITADMAGILEWLGDFDRALVEVERASQFIQPWISEKTPSQWEIVRSLFSGKLEEAQDQAKLLQISLELQQIQARANRYLGNYGAAERQFREIMSNVPAVAQPAIESQLAAILIAARRYDEGLAHVQNLEPTFKGLLRPKLGVLLKYKAEALLGLGQPKQALATVDLAVEDLARYRDQDALWKAQWLRARTLNAQGRPAEALEAFRQSADTINNLRRAPLGYRLDSTYLKDKLPVFAAAIGLASGRGEAETCCRFMEMIKSRILTATLSIAASDAPRTASDLDRQVDELSRRIDALEYAGYRGEWTDEIEQQRQSLLSERASLMEQIRFSDPRWRSLSEPIPFDLDQAFDVLAQNQQAALTLFYQRHRVTAVLLKDGECSVQTVQVTAETTAALEAYQENLQAAQPQPRLYDPSAGLGLVAEDLVPAGILAPALQATSLIIVPHGPLHLLPWAGLTFRGTRLFEYCPVGMLPNLSCLPQLQMDLSSSPRVALIGAPDYGSLPRLQSLLLAPEELQTIQDIYPSPAGVIGEVLMNRAATEDSFWRLAKHTDAAGNILHIACHGNFVTGDPMNSGLLLTDGKIDATEIARSRLQYDEVILSACSTGYRPTEVQGVTLTGDDILGLPGAFLEAGARSVLVSIPRARDDATLQFMTIYHENRSEGGSPLHALQETQKTMLTSPLYPPYLWCGFTVYGCL